MHPETERRRGTWDGISVRYDGEMAFLERWLFKGDREWAASQVKGKTLELAVGTGRNLRHLGPELELDGIDASEAMVDIARRTAAELGRQVRYQVADALDLPYGDETFDTVLVTLSLCCVPDELLALHEVARVLRPGGNLVAVEHGASDRWWLRGVQRVADPVTSRIFGDHQLRDVSWAARQAGLQVRELQRHGFGYVTRLVAEKPEAGRAPQPPNRGAPPTP